MQSAGPQSLIYLVVFVLLVAGLWAILRLQRRRRQQALDALDIKPTLEAPPPGPTEPLAPPAAREPLPQGPAPVAEVPPPAAEPAVVPRKKGAPDLLLDAGLAQTRASLWGRMASILGQEPKLDGAVLEALEEVLLLGDVGVTMTMRLMDSLQAEASKKALAPEEVRELLRGHMLAVLKAADRTHDLDAETPHKPKVILFVGVNGVGKTTTIGKVAHALTAKGKSVVLAAGDTFRAAAAEQLAVWGERTGARVVRGAERADPASVMFNAMQAAQAQGADVLLADTAGRLHTNLELMEEIKKVRRALGRLRADAPDEVWLVVDATTGQNALHQAKQFHEAVTLTGLILTKLDGTAKGGIVVAIAEALKLPVYFVGVGEQADALRPFDAEAFVGALL